MVKRRKDVDSTIIIVIETVVNVKDVQTHGYESCHLMSVENSLCYFRQMNYPAKRSTISANSASVVAPKIKQAYNM